MFDFVELKKRRQPPSLVFYFQKQKHYNIVGELIFCFFFLFLSLKISTKKKKHKFRSKFMILSTHCDGYLSVYEKCNLCFSCNTVATEYHNFFFFLLIYNKW